MRKVTEITEQFHHFVQDWKESFWGDVNGKAQGALRQILEWDSRQQRDRYLCREAYARREGPGDYRHGYYERGFVTRCGTLRLRIAPTRGGGVSAERVAGFSGAGRRGHAADPGSLSTGDFDAEGGSRHRYRDRGAGERADGLDADPEPGPAGETVPRGALERRVGVFVPGRGEPAGGPAPRAGAGAVGVSAQPGRERSGRGRVLAGPLPAGPGRKEPTVDRDRWLRGPGGSAPDRLPPRRAPALLGAQDAQHFGEGTEAGLRTGQGRCPGDLSGL